MKHGRLAEFNIFHDSYEILTYIWIIGSTVFDLVVG